MKLINQGRDDRSCGEIIKRYRKQTGMSQTELAERMNSSRKSITNWESNSSTPDLYAIRRLCEVLEIPDYIMLATAEPAGLSLEERLVIDGYRQIGNKNQNIIRNLIDSMMTVESTEYVTHLKTQYLVMPKELTPSAAGVGCPDMNLPAEPLFIRRNRFSEQADTLITVSGDSMEPNYFDGDLLYVKFTNDCRDGDDVVCVYHEGFILKRHYNHKLYSLNQNRPFGDQHDYDNIRMIGKVIGVVDPDRDLPAPKDLEQLSAIFQNELKQYNQ